MKHYERALIDRGSRSYGTRSVPTTINDPFLFHLSQSAPISPLPRAPLPNWDVALRSPAEVSTRRYGWVHPLTDGV